jgi:hypothetical protein
MSPNQNLRQFISSKRFDVIPAQGASGSLANPFPPHSCLRTAYLRTYEYPANLPRYNRPLLDPRRRGEKEGTMISMSCGPSILLFSQPAIGPLPGKRYSIQPPSRRWRRFGAPHLARVTETIPGTWVSGMWASGQQQKHTCRR